MIFKSYISKPDYWDEFCISNYGFYTQSSYWVSLIDFFGFKKKYYILEDENGIPLIGTFTYKLNSFILKYIDYIPLFLVKIINRFDKISLLQNHLGPIINSSLLNNENKYDIIFYFIINLKSNNSGGILFELFLSENKYDLDKLYKKLSLYGLKIDYCGSTRINLIEPNDFFCKIGPKLRNDIRFGEKSNLTIKTISKDNINNFNKNIYKEIKTTFNFNKIKISGFTYYKKLILSGYNNKLYLIYKDEYLLGGCFITINGYTALEHSTFSTNFGKKLNLRSGEYLRWNIINDLFKTGIKLYDFNMIDLNNNNEKTKNINFYKLKWGGVIFYGIKLL